LRYSSCAVKSNCLCVQFSECWHVNAGTNTIVKTGTFLSLTRFLVSFFGLCPWMITHLLFVSINWFTYSSISYKWNCVWLFSLSPFIHGCGLAASWSFNEWHSIKQRFCSLVIFSSLGSNWGYSKFSMIVSKTAMNINVHNFALF
jgi:hypothetical protein